MSVMSFHLSHGDSLCLSCASGDCRRGQSLVVWAILEGREAAEKVHRYVTGIPHTMPHGMPGSEQSVVSLRFSPHFQISLHL